MTKNTASKSTIRRTIAVLAAGSVALGAYTFGISTSPGSPRGAGFTTSPGRSVAAASNVEKKQTQSDAAVIRNYSARKAGKGQQEYI